VYLGKIAVILWNMVVKRQPYKSQVEYLFLDQKRKLKTVLNIRKQIAKFAQFDREQRTDSDYFTCMTENNKLNKKIWKR
jgi:hypothetical protein